MEKKEGYNYFFSASGSKLSRDREMVTAQPASICPDATLEQMLKET